MFPEQAKHYPDMLNMHPSVLAIYDKVVKLCKNMHEHQHCMHETAVTLQPTLFHSDHCEHSGSCMLCIKVQETVHDQGSSNSATLLTVCDR